ncbi:uncharacterized protein LOC121562872 isoform X2 [Coregonus clupeaformis]|uniref:uncharacterized protein LOC121562872 isoform X2 n=1 Tax=Coregonus clupeaformis TaxID=59861 RepID=UPI001BE03B1D|nr:uncharacterized protein LOC121562872 isoform X2 [Coregonus clupeaformis]
MPEGAGRSSQRKPSNQAAKRPSSVSSLSSIVGRMASSERACRGSCTSVNTVCSDSDRTASLSSSASSASLQDGHSSSSSSSLPYGAVPAFPSSPQRNGSDISLDLTPLSQLPAGVNPATPASPPKLSRLERVALEIVETEQAYVRDLKSIVEDYLGCIIDCGDLPLKPDEVSTLFCNIEDIYEFNSELLEDLERSPHAAAIAECFVERSEAFDIYTLYCMNYPNSVAVLRDCMKNKILVGFFQERQTTLCHSLPLETYLLKPVQRILKYHLLLQELAKHFDKSDPGYEVVEDAIITMTAVAWYINDMKRKQEHAVRLQEIESLLTNWMGPDLSGFGELVLEGSFRVQRVKKERAFFLFDKMLLISKKRLEHFIYSTHIFCCNLLLVETMKDPLCFKVSDQTIPKQQHIVQTKNQEEKRLWLHYLKRLIVENHLASLPQKARQVLGDNFCQSPQFDQDHLKKSSPRCDEYYRGRRQSETPEFIYTPEKAKKSLPLLLEGNLSYRRGRRQSAPTKDFETSFHVSSKAGSEGELCHGADSLGSSGSTNTLASSVIEVEAEAERPDTCLGLEEEDLSPLSLPPTLSITEEIMQFINQSRMREGMAELKHDADPPRDESLEDQTTEPHPCPVAQQGNDQPLASSTEETYESQDPHPNSPEEITVQLEGSRSKMEDQTLPPRLASESSEEGGREGGESTPLPADVIEEMLQEESTSAKETETVGERIASEVEDEQTIKTATPLSPVSLPDKREREKELCFDLPNEDKHSEAPLSPLSVPAHTVQSPLAPKKETQLTKSDRQIIEKIRSYYEAAEAEAGEAGEGDSSPTPRRNSFSLIIPTGLVKDSVSRFAVFGHQDSLCDSESGRSDGGAEPEPESELPSPLLSVPGQGEGILSPDCSSTSAAGSQEEHSQAPGQGEPVVEECSKFEHGSELLPYTELMKEWKEKEKEKVGAAVSIESEIIPNLSTDITKEPSCSDEAAKVITKDQQVINGHGPSSDSTVPPPTGLHDSKTAPVSQVGWGRIRDRSFPTGNLDGLPSQIKVGHWSRHCKMVSSSRTLYEGAAVADVAGIGLFEASPGDPCLVENSERILSKVQMLACMYSAKASSMKVPLHHKRVCVGLAPWTTTTRHSVPPQAQLPQQHHGEKITIKRAQSHSTGCQEIASVSSEPQLFGHVLVSEQLSPTYRQQENSCVLAGPRDSVSNLGSTSFASPHSSPLTTPPKTTQVGPEEVVTTAVEGKLMENQSEEVISEAEMRRPHPKWGSPGQEGPIQGVGMEVPADGHSGTPEMSVNLSRTRAEQKGHHLYSIREDPALGAAAASFAGPCGNKDRSPGIGAAEELQKTIQQQAPTEPEKSQVVKPDKDSLNTKIMSPYVASGAERRSSPQMAPSHQSKAESTKEKSRDGTLDDRDVSPAAPKISPHISNIPTQQKSISGLTEGSNSLVWRPTQSPMTEPMQATHTSGQRVKESQVPEDSKGKEGGMVPHPWSSHQSSTPTPPPGVQSSDSLPKFTNQRPPNLHLPTTMGRRSLPMNLNGSNNATLPSQRLPPAPLRSREPGQDPSLPSIHASGLSPVRRPSSQPSLERSATLPPGIGHPMDAKPPSAFSPSKSLCHRSPSPIRGLPCSSPTPSALTKSLAASCISQSISQSLAKKNARLQGQATPPPDSPASLAPAPTASPLRMRSPSPKLTSGPGGPPLSPGHAHASYSRDGSECPPFPLRSTSLRSSPCPCPSPSPALSPPPYRSQRSVSPVSLHHTTSSSASPQPRPAALDQPRHIGLNGNSNNNNNNNNNTTNGGWAMNHRMPPLVCANSIPHPHDSLWSGSTHTPNRVARPFSASEPSSRVQSPSPSPSPFSRICSPPPVQNHTGPLMNKPPNPRSTRTGGASPFNHLGLSLELPRASSACSSGINSPRITSPPPIGVPANVWGVAAPQPRNAKLAFPSSSIASATWRDGFSPSMQRSSSTTSSPPSGFSPCSPTPSQNLQRTKGSSLPFLSLADQPPSPVRNGRRSWGESGGCRAVGAEQESGLMSPRGGSYFYSGSYSGSPSCLSPGALSPVRLAPGKSTHGGQHFTSIAWPDVRELLTKYDSGDSPDRSAPTSPVWPQDEWGDPDLGEDSCRSRLICANVPRASPAPDMGAPIQYPHRSEPKPEDTSSTQAARRTLKTSYATTVNLQIAGSGRITSFSNTQVSLSQTLAPVVDNKGRRRVSINACNLTLPVPQNCKRM